MNPYRRQKGILKARKALNVLRNVSSYNSEFYAEDGECAKRMLRTRVPCSCVGCGNPRRHFGDVTRQEKLADIREKEQLEELSITNLPTEIIPEQWWFHTPEWQDEERRMDAELNAVNFEEFDSAEFRAAWEASEEEHQRDRSRIIECNQLTIIRSVYRDC